MFFPQGAAIDRILGEIVHSKSMITPIDYVLCIGHFLGKVIMQLIYMCISVSFSARCFFCL